MEWLIAVLVAVYLISVLVYIVRCVRRYREISAAIRALADRLGEPKHGK